jgi:hypothetical protein
LENLLEIVQELLRRVYIKSTKEGEGKCIP